MNQDHFIKLLNHPEKISAAQTRELEDILMTAPYFQAARAIRLKGLKEHQEFSYNAALKKTAAYTTDRSVLFEFITSPEFLQNEIAAKINAQETKLKDLPVFEAEEVFGKRSIAIDEAIKMKQSESDRVMDPSLFSEAQPPKKNTILEKEVAKEKLGIGKPLEFNASESHSFSEWLQLTTSIPVAREAKESKAKQAINKKFELIEEFISKSPRMKPGKSTAKTNLAERSTVPPESLMTETLAKVYLEQNNYAKAIQAYKILILKNPEKSGFFADQIRAIEKLQENNTE